MKKTIKILAPIIILVLIAVGIYFSKIKTNNDELVLYGNIENRTVDVGFRIDGRVEKLLKEEGDSVKKGELIAFIESEKYKALYNQSVADIETASAAKDTANSVFERNFELCKDGTTSKLDCDKIFNAKEEANSRLEAAIQRSKVAKDNLNNTSIYAPCDGIIMTRVVEQGAVVVPTSSVYTIAISEPVWVRAYVSEKDLGNIKYHMQAEVLTDSTIPNTKQKRSYSGYIGFISPVAEFTPKTVQTTDLRTDLVYRIRVYVDKTDDFLRQGMPVTVKIKLSPNAQENPDKYVNQDNPLGTTENENAINGY